MKYSFDGKKCTADYDPNDTKDKVEILRKQSKGKNLKKLTDIEKIVLFDAYVDAGVITL